MNGQPCLVGRGVLYQVGCLCERSLATFCSSTCLLFILFSPIISAVQSETCVVLPLGPLEADVDLWHPVSPGPEMCDADKGGVYPNPDISTCPLVGLFPFCVESNIQFL